MLKFPHLILVVIFSSLGVTHFALATEKTNKPIVLGISNALSGPAEQLGRRLNQGSDVYFNKVNMSGGIAGRKVDLVIEDDGYEPFKTLTNTQSLLNKSEVFAFFNFVGTPTTYAVMPMVKRSELPFLMPFTGAEFLRTPSHNRIFNLRASYFQEANAQIQYLVNKKKITRIGLLIQADEFGLAVEQGYLKIMKTMGIKPVISTRYRRNTQDISLALAILKTHKVEAVAFVGTYEPLAELINSAAKQAFKPFYSTVSFVSSHELFRRIKTAGPVSLLVTEVMPDPNTCQALLCRQFITDMNNAGFHDLDQIQLEGYINAHVFTESAKQCGTELTADCLMDKLNQLPVNFFPHHKHQTSELPNRPPVYLNLFESSRD